jgi:hypothetical protein
MNSISQLKCKGGRKKMARGGQKKGVGDRTYVQSVKSFKEFQKRLKQASDSLGGIPLRDEQLWEAVGATPEDIKPFNDYITSIGNIKSYYDRNQISGLEDFDPEVFDERLYNFNPQQIKRPEEFVSEGKVSVKSPTIGGGLGKLKYQEGGEKTNILDQLLGLAGVDNLGELSSKLNLSSEVANELSSFITSPIQNKAIEAAEDYDIRKDPTQTLKTQFKAQTAGNLISGTLKGAGTGFAVAGPLGAGIGAGLGFVKEGLTSLFGKKGRDRAIAEAKKEWSSGWKDRYDKFAATESYQDGGKVKGPGGPKDDKIVMAVDDGSFIVPAENADKAMKIGREYLGWGKEQRASRDSDDSEIRISDGEVIFNPEESAMLEYYGVDLNALAPNANKENKMKTGGKKYKKHPSAKKAKEMLENPPHNEPLSEKQKKYFQALVHGWKPGYQDGSWKTGVGGQILKEYEEFLGENETEEEQAKKGLADINWEKVGKGVKSASKFLPEVLASVQFLGAMEGLKRAGRMPDLQISNRLKRLAEDTRKEAQYGMPPDVKSAYLREIERTRRDAMSALVAKGGSVGEVASGLSMLTSQVLQEKGKLPIIDEEMRQRKRALNADIEKFLSGQELDIQKMDLAMWQDTQNIYAGMLNTAIGNFIGARQYKENLDYLRTVGGTTPTWNLIQSKKNS